MKLRPMTMEDCSKVAEIEAATFSDAWSYEVFVGCLLQDNYCMLVAVNEEDDSDIWGYFIYYTVLDEGDICNVCVRSDKRRQGIAEEMLDYVIDISKKQELSILFLEVREGNTPARNLYEKKGFTANGLRKNYYTDPVENAVLMERSLEG